MSATPGAGRWSGAALGAHNEDVYGKLLGLAADEITRLSQAGVI